MTFEICGRFSKFTYRSGLILLQELHVQTVGFISDLPLFGLLTLRSNLMAGNWEYTQVVSTWVVSLLGLASNTLDSKRLSLLQCLVNATVFPVVLPNPMRGWEVLLWSKPRLSMAVCKVLVNHEAQGSVICSTQGQQYIYEIRAVIDDKHVKFFKNRDE